MVKNNLFLKACVSPKVNKNKLREMSKSCCVLRNVQTFVFNFKRLFISTREGRQNLDAAAKIFHMFRKNKPLN